MPNETIMDEVCGGCAIRWRDSVCSVCFRCELICGCDSEMHTQFDQFVKDSETDAQDMADILANWYSLHFEY